MTPIQHAQRGNSSRDTLINLRERNPAKAYHITIDVIGKRWLFKGIMARGETSAWIAPPGGLKSALMAEATICAANGTDWHGRRNKGVAGVVYFALERAELVTRRLQAHRAQQNLGQLPIAIVSSTINLMSQRTVPAVLATIHEAEICFGLPTGLVIFDTFAKLIAAGGGDEDKAKDQGAVFANIQRIKEKLDVHVALVGHTGKDETRGARGSNAILGDADVMVKIAGDTVRTAAIIKANELPEGPLFSFTSELHEFGTDEDGDPVSVNIISPVDVLPPVATEDRLTKNQQTMFAVLHGAGAAGLTLAQWNERARDAGLGLGRKADLYDFRTSLATKGLVGAVGDRWIIR